MQSVQSMWFVLLAVSVVMTMSGLLIMATFWPRGSSPGTALRKLDLAEGATRIHSASLSDLPTHSDAAALVMFTTPEGFGRQLEQFTCALELAQRSRRVLHVGSRIGAIGHDDGQTQPRWSDVFDTHAMAPGLEVVESTEIPGALQCCRQCLAYAGASENYGWIHSWAGKTNGHGWTFGGRSIPSKHTGPPAADNSFKPSVAPRPRGTLEVSALASNSSYTIDYRPVC